MCFVDARGRAERGRAFEDRLESIPALATALQQMKTELGLSDTQVSRMEGLLADQYGRVKAVVDELGRGVSFDSLVDVVAEAKLQSVFVGRGVAFEGRGGRGGEEVGRPSMRCHSRSHRPVFLFPFLCIVSRSFLRVVYGVNSGVAF